MADDIERMLYELGKTKTIRAADKELMLQHLQLQMSKPLVVHPKKSNSSIRWASFGAAAAALTITVGIVGSLHHQWSMNQDAAATNRSQNTHLETPLTTTELASEVGINLSNITATRLGKSAPSWYGIPVHQVQNNALYVPQSPSEILASTKRSSFNTAPIQYNLASARKLANFPIREPNTKFPGWNLVASIGFQVPVQWRSSTQTKILFNPVQYIDLYEGPSGEQVSILQYDWTKVMYDPKHQKQIYVVPPQQAIFYGPNSEMLNGFGSDLVIYTRSTTDDAKQLTLYHRESSGEYTITQVNGADLSTLELFLQLYQKSSS